MPPTPIDTFRVGTRGSLLARAQSEIVVEVFLKLHPVVRVDLRTISTTGDRLQGQPLKDAGGKGLFTKEIEQALLDGAIDIAIHSFKDVPVTMPLVREAKDRLVVAAVPEREEPWDVLVSTKFSSIDELPPAARVGTGSLRRRCQLLARRPDLRVEPVRGNIDTRLKKLRANEFDAIVLALAGLKRTKLFDEKIMHPIAPELLLPAAGQAALALQCRADDQRVRDALAGLNDADAFDCVAAERAVVLGLSGDCYSPIAAHAVIDRDDLTLQAVVGRRGGEPPLIAAAARAPRREATGAVERVLEQLREHGAEVALRGNDTPSSRGAENSL